MYWKLIHLYTFHNANTIYIAEKFPVINYIISRRFSSELLQRKQNEIKDNTRVPRTPLL